MSNEKVSEETDYIVVNLSHSSEKVPLSKVRKILQIYQDDIYDYNKKLDTKRLGKILTIIDAAISDETQRKAVKDMVHDAWHSPHYIEGHYEYPRIGLVTDAIGFNLYDDIEPDALPAPIKEPYNKYKNL